MGRRVMATQKFDVVSNLVKTFLLNLRQLCIKTRQEFCHAPFPQNYYHQQHMKHTKNMYTVQAVYRRGRMCSELFLFHLEMCQKTRKFVFLRQNSVTPTFILSL
jgi:hypothetical protein